MTLLIIFFIFLIGSIILWAKTSIKNWAIYWPSLGVQFLQGENIIQRILNQNYCFIQQDVDMYTQLKKMGKKYGGYMELWNPIWYVADLDLLKNILIKDFDHFADHRGFATSADPHLYLNLFNLKGEPWRDLRVKMTPAFTTGKIRRMFQIFDDCAQKLVGSLESNLQNSLLGNSTTIELRPHIQNVCMNLIANAAFGVRTDSFENGQNSKFMQMSHSLLKIFSTPTNIIKFSITTMLPRVAEFLKLSLMDAKTDQFFSQMVLTIVKKRAADASPSGGRFGDTKMMEDYIQIMFNIKTNLDAATDTATAPGGGKSKLEFSEDMLIAQCLVFIIGGFDTADALLSWAVYELALCPEIQEKLYTEIKTGFDDNGGQFSYDLVVNQMTYLDQVVQETLRKYPSPVRFDRMVTRAYKIPDSDIVLPKGTMVMIPVYAIHHDPEIYAEPERFIPERFTKENCAKRHPCAFASFGVGPRVCLGSRFALAEAKFVIAHLILNFKLEPSQQTLIPPKFTGGVALKPIDGIPLNVTRRSF